MIRVLQVVNSMNVGGMETFIMNIYRNIDRTTVQFDFLVHTEKESYYDEEIKKLGGNIFNIPPRNKGIKKNRESLEAFFKKNNVYKIVHQHVSSLSYIEPLIVSKKYNVPVRIIHGHSTRQPGSSFHKFFHRLNQWRIDSIATDYFACSENSAKWLFDKSKVTKNMYTIINNGIQTGKFTFDVKLRDKVRKSLGIEGKLVLGHTGRFAPPKNHDFLIDIFKSVNKFNPNAVLLLIGEGELKPQIEKKVQLNGLDDNVFFLGVRADVGDILQAIDVFIFPSYYEGLPLTLVEAQAADLPCLVSDSITKKVRITDTITYKSLSEKPKTWALKVLNLPKEKRVDKTDSIFKSGYDAFEISTKLMKFYLERLAKY